MYIQLVSIHGLVRGNQVEMGRDADTGGQVRYVLELARKLGEFDEVHHVDLFTRRIKDKRVSDDYSEELEQLTPNVRLIRLPCGGGTYYRKEKLWPSLDEFVSEMIAFTRREGRTPAVVHGHYADAGYVAREVAEAFGVPFIFTGHSLGKPKLEYLIQEGWTQEKADSELCIDHRIAVEQECIQAADFIVTSTTHERDTQYSEYRCEEARFEVIPPGTNLERFFPFYEYDMPNAEIDEHFKQARFRMSKELQRFHFAPDKPLILALCRPDRRKNIGALIDAYGKSRELQAIANLAIFAGIRDDIESMSENEREVLTDMLLSMDRYDLYGKLAIPKDHSSEYDVPELYRLAAEKRGIFVNTAFIELFGLTAIEASAAGLPFVATKNGGPEDIVENCQSGFLVDVSNLEELTSRMLELLTDTDLWEEKSNNGVNRVRTHYSWDTHCKRYLEAINNISPAVARSKNRTQTPPVASRFEEFEYILCSDVDDTLVGDPESLSELMKLLEENRDRIGFCVASGRSANMIYEVLNQHGIKHCDFMISQVGAEIHYGPGFDLDRGWAKLLHHKWKPDQIRECLDDLPFLALQSGAERQHQFKISYELDENADADQAINQIHDLLRSNKLHYNLLFSHGVYVDLLPRRASKVKALRYLARKWCFPLMNVIAVGNSDNDWDMLRGPAAGIIVGNQTPDPQQMKKTKSNRVYVATQNFAAGILEGLKHYDVIGESLESIEDPAALSSATGTTAPASSNDANRARKPSPDGEVSFSE